MSKLSQAYAILAIAFVYNLFMMWWLRETIHEQSWILLLFNQWAILAFHLWTAFINHEDDK